MTSIFGLVMQEALLSIKESEKFHFVISLFTNIEGFVASESLKKKFPETMTVILQHKFKDLVVKDWGFIVTLSFDGVEENIEVPFSGIISFAAMMSFKDDVGNFYLEIGRDGKSSTSLGSGPAEIINIQDFLD